MSQRVVQVKDLKQLVLLPVEDLAACDIAAVNLACAVGLPGAPTELEVSDCLRKLDEWAKFVRRYTELSHEQFFLPNPERYGHSEAYFRSLCLVTALQRHCGLRYNPAKIPEDTPLETADTFIHGAFSSMAGFAPRSPWCWPRSDGDWAIPSRSRKRKRPNGATCSPAGTIGKASG